MSDLSDLCLGAIKAIECCGWRQGNYGGETDGGLSPCCLYGAARTAHRHGAPYNPVMEAQLEEKILLITGVYGVSYNDAPGRTKEEVIALLQRIADENP